MTATGMDAATRRALRGINRRFYERVAAEFSGSRERPWPGWRRILRQVATPAGSAPAVLDVGCGNGRFGRFLADRLPSPFRYVGVDGCERLLRFARERLGDDVELHHLDVLDADLDRALDGRRFDLVTLFGVLHHVPGAAARRDLLRRLAALVAAGGALAASIWRLDRSDRFPGRVLPWETYNRDRGRRGLTPIDPAHLEDGDVLLGWGGGTEHPRYCHFPGDAEIAGWLRALEAPAIDRFDSDGPSGRDNLYLVFRRTAPPAPDC